MTLTALKMAPVACVSRKRTLFAWAAPLQAACWAGTRRDVSFEWHRETQARSLVRRTGNCVIYMTATAVVAAVTAWTAVTVVTAVTGLVVAVVAVVAVVVVVDASSTSALTP